MRSRPLDEELDRVADRQVGRADGLPWRQRHGRHPVNALAFDAERLPRRRQEPDTRAVPDDAVAESGRRVDDVLAVVEDKHDILAGQHLDDRLQRGRARVVRQPKRRGDRARHLVIVSHRGQLREPDAVAGRVQQLRRGLQRQPRLAAAARTGERHQP